MQKIVIFGAGGFGRETAMTIEKINSIEAKYDVLGYLVDEEYYSPGERVRDYPILGTSEWFRKNYGEVECVCAIGRPKDRQRVMQKLESKGVRFCTLIHPDAGIDTRTAKIGEGTIIQAGSLIGPDVVIGKGVFINSGIHIGHDCRIDDYVTIYPRCQISGGVHIETRTMVGAMSFLNEKVKIGEGAVVAAGSIVFRNVKRYTHVMGNPAKKVDL